MFAFDLASKPVSGFIRLGAASAAAAALAGCGTPPKDDGQWPPPACYPAGTSCTGVIQFENYCCGDGVRSKQAGWCVGIWAHIPCRPLE
jgi:hypothetical protein